MEEKIKEIRNLIESIGDATCGLIEADLLPSYIDHSLEASFLIEVGYDNSDMIFLQLQTKKETEISISARIVLEEDGSLTCVVEAFDFEEHELGEFELPKLKTFLTNHPTLGFKDAPIDLEFNHYLYKEVPPHQITIAFLATVMAIQEFLSC